MVLISIILRKLRGINQIKLRFNKASGHTYNSTNKCFSAMSIVRPGIATMDASCSIKDSHNSINFIFSEQSSSHRRWAMIPFKPVLAPVVVVLQVLFNREVEAIVRSSVCREASWIYFRKLGSNLSLWPSIEQWSPAQNHHKVLGYPPLRHVISCLQDGFDAPP